MQLRLLTSRLLLEPLTAGDTGAFVTYRQDPDVARWQSWEPTYSELDAAELIANQPATGLPATGNWVQLAIRDVEATTVHGDVAVHLLGDQPNTFEIGVTLARASQGRGIGTEAVERVLHYLFTEAGAHRVVASCDARNVPVVVRTSGPYDPAGRLAGKASCSRGLHWTLSWADACCIWRSAWPTAPSSLNGALQRVDVTSEQDGHSGGHESEGHCGG